MAATTSRLSRVSAWLGRVCLLLALLGPALAHFDLVAPILGFVGFMVGVGLGLLSLVLGAIALVLGPPGTRGTTAIGMVLPFIVVGTALLVSGARPNLPRINDITTDTQSPPQFLRAGTLEENAGSDMSYPGLVFAEQQKAGYPDLGPLILAMPPDEAFKQVAATARSMPNWVITREDAELHALEGYDTSRLFHFRDDFVIEVRAADNAQSAVQMRSKSRDGQGDLGANAARIRTFFNRLKS